jgi:hypothetical protein
VAGIDDQEVDGPDEASGPDRWTKGQDGPTDHGSLRLGDEDAGLREVHELTEQIRCVERARVTVFTKVVAAKGDETIDIRDTRDSDQVFHAEASYLAGRRPSPLDRGPIRPRVGTDGTRSHVIRVRGTRQQGCDQPVLHSGRQCL